ncbi:PucR family transcriptional regulator [Leucobacter celer]|uniref:PucR family transcriptional regulator n=1 Tax=Leucobacter celer TaxID=668625 RepID=UPI0006A7C98C|nr:PucR family transcriptional regulator [Leucobacter celer]
MDELLERLIRAAAYSGVRGVLSTLATQLGLRSAVFAMGGTLIESRPADLGWNYEDVLAAGAKEDPLDGLHVIPLKDDVGTIMGFFAAEAPGERRSDLAAAAQLITMDLRRLGAKAEGERALFRDVLDDIVTERSSPAEIRVRLQLLGLESDDEVKVLVGVCRSPADNLSNIPWETYALAGKLRSAFLRSAYKGAMVMVIPDADLAEEIAVTLLECLEELGAPATVGVSALASIDGVRAAYFEALAASSNGPGIQRSGTLDLSALLAQNNVPGSVISASKHLLAPLIEYDTRYGTDYLHTLRAYLQYDRKVVRVAEAFFMHRNTIRYRLNQISEILGGDLESTRNLVNLTIAMQLHEAGFTQPNRR